MNRGRECVGEGKNLTECSGDYCKIDGNWGDWSPWSYCGNNCKKTRKRLCDNPAPVNGGRDCSGDVEESRTCCREPCCTKLESMPTAMVINSSQIVDVSGWRTDIIKVLAIGGGGGSFIVSIVVNGDIMY